VVWSAPDMLKKLVPPEVIEKSNEVELIIYLKNGSQIHVKGADDPNSLRGSNAYGIVLDEYAQIKKEVFDEIYLPIVLANGGWIWIIGTPKGKNHFYDRYNIALGCSTVSLDWSNIFVGLMFTEPCKRLA